GNLYGFAGVAEIFQRAAEKFPFGQNGERGGSGGFERRRERNGIEWFAKDSARGRRGFQFSQDVEARTRERRGKIAQRGGGSDTVLERRFWQDLFAMLNFGAARFENAVEDGSSGNRCVHGCELSC